MGRLRSRGLQLSVAILCLICVGACGGRKPAGQSPYPAKVTISPASSTSVQIGSTFNFTASAQNSNNANVNVTFTYKSSDTSILNVAPNGVACAGVWDAAFTSCTPGNIGVAQVTASAIGATSEPTYVFVHPVVDNIVVQGVLLDGLPIQEPCLPQGKSMTVQATAYSQGVDVTASVGPFTWSANNSGVVKLTPINNSNYTFPTNQATATAVTPGLTYIYATASGVSSTSFRQPGLPAPGATTPPPPAPFEFFETCPVQNIVLELNNAGSAQNSFDLAKGATGQSVVATIVDVLGNSSLPNLNGGVVLSKIPLTWSASQPGSINVASGCTQSCGLTLAGPGAGSVTASCAPPSCNVGFPLIPASISPANDAACVSYVHQYYPQITTCQAFIPKPVYASMLPTSPVTCGQATQLPCSPAISGVISGATGTTSIIASSLGCANSSPAACNVSMYDFSSGKSVVGAANPIPSTPNSMLFDLTGDKIYMGSNYGAEVITPANFGTSNSPFSGIGTVTGNALAVSPNGNFAIFSDTLHAPNQVYVANLTNASSPVVTPLNISAATAAAFSPDNQKAFIFGKDSNNNPNLFVYSTFQALQTVPLPAGTSVSAITFSTNGAFVYLAEPSLGGAGPAVSVLNNCDNSPYTDSIKGTSFIPLTSAPVAFKALPDGIHFIALEDGGVIDYITAQYADTTFGMAATPQKPAQFLCSGVVGGTTEYALTVGHNTPQTINLNLGSIHPINFFTSADGSLIYILASDLNSIIVYDFATNSVTGGIQLISTAGGVNPTPLSADMTVDGGTIVVAGSDGYVHQVSTSIGGSDIVQNQFPNLPNYYNPFCTNSSKGPCPLNLVLAKP